MVYGPDLASPQAGIDIASGAKTWKFALAKAGGYNTGTLYVAPHYAAQIDQFIDHDLPHGHYWVIGRGDPKTQANYFAKHLHRFNKYKDIIMLDNERLDENAGFFGTAECVTFLETARKALGLPASRCWVYANKSDMAHLDTKLLRRKGYRIHLAYYPTPNNGNLHGNPDVYYDIWQFTSNHKFGSHTIDFNYTAHAVSTLFGNLQTKIPKTTTVTTGNPGIKSNFWMRMHLLAKKGGYTGSIRNTQDKPMWEGIQHHLKNSYGYKGVVDGIPGPLTYLALQKMAHAKGGYNGPQDGLLGTNSYRAIARYINTL